MKTITALMLKGACSVFTLLLTSAGTMGSFIGVTFIAEFISVLDSVIV